MFCSVIDYFAIFSDQSTANRVFGRDYPAIVLILFPKTMNLKGENPLQV
jgi:hypothetical protein